MPIADKQNATYAKPRLKLQNLCSNSKSHMVFEYGCLLCSLKFMAMTCWLKMPLEYALIRCYFTALDKHFCSASVSISAPSVFMELHLYNGKQILKYHF